MDRESIRAIKIFSKYGVIIFYLYVLKSIITNFFSKHAKEDYGWKFDFSFDQAPNKIQVRELESRFSNLSIDDFEESEVKEDIYPLS